MAEESAGEKTEAPTPRRASQFREKGQAGQSAELSQVIGLIAAFYGLKKVIPELWHDLVNIFEYVLSPEVLSDPLSLANINKNLFYISIHIGPKVLMIMFIAALFGAGSTAIQTKFLWSWALVKPNFGKLNPLNGIKRIFSLGNSFNLLKQICKLGIIFPIAYSAFFELFPQFNKIAFLSSAAILPLTGTMAGMIFKRIILLMLFLAIIDFAYQKYTLNKQMKMSKEELKEERKSVEGDETIRKKIISLGLQRARERMMKNVPKADVIVTNPTHIAVALVYSGEAGSAPKVVAKGQGHVAERIKEIGRRHGVPVIERKPLARALFKVVEVGSEIPQELFRAVAEILAYVYKLKGKNPVKSRKK